MPKATLPGHLESYNCFIEHLDANMAAWQTVQKGDAFAAAALKLLTIDPSFASFSNLRPNPKKSHDEGIDIFGATERNDVALGCQSKFKIKTVDEFDGILSKFQAYDFKGKGEAPEFDFDEGDPTLYVIVTASRLENIRERYASRNFASRQFYDRLVGAKRLEVIDGPRMLRVIQEAYTKQFEVPHQLNLQSTSGWINVDGAAWLGFVRGDNLVQLHDSFGDGLFFENIRDFLGPKSGQKTPDDVFASPHSAGPIARLRLRAQTIRKGRMADVSNGGQSSGPPWGETYRCRSISYACGQFKKVEPGGGPGSQPSMLELRGFFARHPLNADAQRWFQWVTPTS
jgi:hypothetical protein